MIAAIFTDMSARPFSTSYELAESRGTNCPALPLAPASPIGQLFISVGGADAQRSWSRYSQIGLDLSIVLMLASNAEVDTSVPL